MSTRKIHDFLDHSGPETPCLVMDLEVIRETYDQLERALPQAAIYYAVKANPAAQIKSRALHVRAGGPVWIRSDCLFTSARSRPIRPLGTAP